MLVNDWLKARRRIFMKSIEVIVPRRLILEFYPHPEFYGDFVVTLVNGMYTDVYYRDEGELITLTNDIELIDYLCKQEVQPVNYMFKNGVFGFRRIGEDKFLEYWNSINPIQVFKRKTEFKTNYASPKKLIATYFTIDFGVVEFDFGDDSLSYTLSVFDMRWINSLNIDYSMDILEEFLKRL
jgi:hypothetical protein